MEYTVKLTLVIWNKERKKFAAGTKELVLPFVPFVGLRFIEKKGPINYPISSVSWSPEENCFHCEIETLDDDYHFSIDYMVKAAKKSDWKGFDQVFDANL